GPQDEMAGEPATELIPIILRVRVEPLAVAPGLLVPRPVELLHVVLEGREHLPEGLPVSLRVVRLGARVIEDTRSVVLPGLVLHVVKLEVFLRASAEVILLEGLELLLRGLADDHHKKMHTPPCS